MLPLEQAVSARTYARTQRASTDAFVHMALADVAFGRTALVTRAFTLHWPRLPYMLCTAAAPHPSLQSSAGLQLEQIAAAGNAAEKALLADVTEKSPDPSYIRVELLRLFKVRRSVVDGHS